MLSEQKIQDYADELLCCWQQQTTVAPLTKRSPDISIEDAYHISRRVLDMRTDPRSTNPETIIGKKIGVTSDAVQSMLGVYEPDFGFLTDQMRYRAGVVPIGNLIQPRAEAEIAFCLKKDLPGSNITREDVLDATDYVMTCFEIVDSRIANWNIKIQDTVADNASCGVFVLGDEQIDPRTLDLSGCRAEVSKNGEFLSAGSGAAVQGSPLQSIAWLANTFAKLGIPLTAGEIILSGSLVPLEPVGVGDSMAVNIEGIGRLEIEFVESA